MYFLSLSNINHSLYFMPYSLYQLNDSIMIPNCMYKSKNIDIWNEQIHNTESKQIKISTKKINGIDMSRVNV